MRSSTRRTWLTASIVLAVATIVVAVDFQFDMGLKVRSVFVLGGIPSEPSDGDSWKYVVGGGIGFVGLATILAAYLLFRDHR